MYLNSTEIRLQFITNPNKNIIVKSGKLMTTKGFNPGNKAVISFYLSTKDGVKSKNLYSIVIYSPNKCNLTYQFYEDLFKSNCFKPKQNSATNIIYLHIILLLTPDTISIPGKTLSAGDSFEVSVTLKRNDLRKINIYYSDTRQQYFIPQKYSIRSLNPTEVASLNKAISVKIMYKSGSNLSLANVTSKAIQLKYIGTDIIYDYRCDEIASTFLKRRNTVIGYNCPDDRFMGPFYLRKGKNFLI